MARTTDTTTPDWEALARQYGAQAARTAGGVLGLNAKALREAAMAQAYATLAIMEQGAKP